jgi:hypothetical protein
MCPHSPRLEIGKKVIQPSKPEWGNGTVLEFNNTEVKIQFEKVGLKIIRYKQAAIPLKEGYWPPPISEKLIKLLNPCLGYHIPTTGYAANILPQDKFSEEMMRIKDKDLEIIKEYANQIIIILKFSIYQDYLRNSIICAAPSSKKDNLDTGIKKLAHFLLKNLSLVDGIDLLIRTESIDKASHGGPRDKALHIRTISIEEKNLIKNKNVFLIDDISTTGATIDACEYLLKEVGALQVIPMTLAETIYVKDYKSQPNHEAKMPQKTFYQKKIDWLKKYDLNQKNNK